MNMCERSPYILNTTCSMNPYIYSMITWMYRKDVTSRVRFVPTYTQITPTACGFIQVTRPLSWIQEIIPAIGLGKIPHWSIWLYMVLKSNCNSITCIDEIISIWIQNVIPAIDVIIDQYLNSIIDVGLCNKNHIISWLVYSFQCELIDIHNCKLINTTKIINVFTKSWFKSNQTTLLPGK